MLQKTLLIKNMVCSCCVRVAKQELEACGCTVNEIRIGVAQVTYTASSTNLEHIQTALKNVGMDIIKDREDQIVEQIKNTVIELIHQLNNVDSLVRKSDYLVEKLNMNYQSMSKLFSKHESITLEKFIILHKIERIKELINSNEFTLSEIAYMMDYSSVHYLSNQFKKITGSSVSDYKKSPQHNRISLDSIGSIASK